MCATAYRLLERDMRADPAKVMTAPLPPQPISKSNASPGLIAWIIIAKFCDGLPLYRLEKMFPRIGIVIPRSTLANWMIRCGILVQPLIDAMHAAQISYDVLQMDETTVQVLKEKDRAPQSKSYMWVRRGGPPDKPVILFDYDPSRGGKVPARILENFKGVLQTDGYEGYSSIVRLRQNGSLAKRDDITWVACLAHVRRKFDEALKAQPRAGLAEGGGIAKQGFDFMQRLYRIEREARERGFDANQRKALRDEKAKPIWNEMRIWLDEVRSTVPPQVLTGKALNYLDSHSM